MKYFLSFLLFLFINQNKINAQSRYVFQNNTHSFKLTLNWFDKTSMWGASDSTVKSIEVTRLKDNKIIQEIIPEENYITDKKHELIFDDFNFDGFIDFKLFSFEAKHGQTGYQFYLYDPIKQKYYYSKEIASILDDADVDKEKKTLSHIYRLMGGDYQQVVCTYVSGKLTIIEQREDKNFEGNKIEIIIKKRINGKLKVIKHQIISEEEYIKMKDRIMPI